MATVKRTFCFGVWGTSYFGDLQTSITGADNDELRRSRLVARASEGVAITGGGFFMNAAVALDNREPLPPFVPVFRNMDGIFAHSLQCCFDDAFLAFEPYLVRHAPPGRRRSAKGLPLDSSNAGVVRTSDLLTYGIRSFRMSTKEATGVDKIQAVGHYLNAIASAAPPILDGILMDWREQILSRQLAYLHYRLETAGNMPSPSWTEDVKAQAKAIAQALARRSCAALEFSKSERVISRDLLMKRVAEGFLHWGAIWRAARQEGACLPQ